MHRELKAQGDCQVKAAQNPAHDAAKARDELGWSTTLDVLDYIAEFKRLNPRGGG